MLPPLTLTTKFLFIRNVFKLYFCCLQAARKSSQLSTLEKQLEEKTITLTAAVARNTELEQELAVKLLLPIQSLWDKARRALVVL